MGPFILLAPILILLFYLYFKRPARFPPGPLCLPVIGSLHITKDIPHLACMELAKKYGPIVDIKFGGQWTVMLHGSKLIRAAFSEAALSGRKATEATSFLVGDEYGITQASGEVWSEQRRFAIRTLRDFGFGKSRMEDLILDEATELTEWIRDNGEHPVELSRRFTLAIGNSLWRILAGKRYKHDDATLIEVLDKLESTQRALLSFTSPLKLALLFFYPNVAKRLSFWTGWDQLVESAKSKTDLFDNIIKQHAETLDPAEPRDFIDVFLNQINQTKHKTSVFHPSIGMRALRSVITDLFVAGSETTSVTLNWAILYILCHPDVQLRMQEELDRVIGRSRSPNLNDRKNLPYTEAVIMETLRKSSVVNIGLTHLCVEDIELGGYVIPKGTIVHANLYEAHHDPQVWIDPHVFRPERFLKQDGTCIQHHDSLFSFSVGRRVCMGENLARDTLFLFVAILVQNFNICIPKGAQKPTLEPRLGQTLLHAHKFEVCMTVRS